jgi:hypothetical protein
MGLCHHSVAMELDVFHGADGDAILGIIRDGSMHPAADHLIFYSARLEDVFQHGGDRKRNACFGFKAKITLPAGASQKRAALDGNPLAIVVTSTLPVPTQIFELYVRRVRSSEFETIRGIDMIKGYLVRAAQSAKE